MQIGKMVMVWLATIVFANLILGEHLVWASEGASNDLMGCLDPKVMSIILGIWIVSAIATVTKPERGLLFVGVLGAGVSWYLAQQHFSTEVALCDINSICNCSVVNKSQYSEMFGIPIALFGFGHFVVTGLLATQQNEDYKAKSALLIVSYGISVLYSLILGFLSYSILGQFCLFCVSLYGLNIIGLWAALKLRATTASAVSMFQGKSFGTAVFTFAISVLASNLLITPANPLGTSKNTKLDVMDLVEALSVDLPLDGTEPLYGDANAPIQIVEFADFECPHCAMVAPELKELLKSNAQVNMRFKHYPISSICNPQIERVGHENACAAAIATDCALQQGKFWEMNALVFQNQNYLSPKDLEFLAEQVGLDLPQFTSCVANPEMVKGIQSDVEAANIVNVTGTPSVYIKGIGTGDAQKKWYKVTAPISQLKNALKTDSP